MITYDSAAGFKSFYGVQASPLAKHGPKIKPVKQIRKNTFDFLEKFALIREM